MRVRKRYWLAPIMFAMLLLNGLLVFISRSVVAPFIYALFWQARNALCAFSAYRRSITTARLGSSSVAGAQEERYARKKYEFERLLETYIAFSPRGFPSFRMAMPPWPKENLFQKRLLAESLDEFDGDIDWSSKLLFAERLFSYYCPFNVNSML